MRWRSGKVSLLPLQAIGLGAAQMINASPSPFIYPGKHARDFLVTDSRSLQQVRDRSRAEFAACF